MKLTLRLTYLFILFTCLAATVYAQPIIVEGQWTFASGSTQSSAAGVYGTKGAAAAGNTPGARVGACSWTDADGKLWLMGGTPSNTGSGSTLNDLWKYDPTTGLWAWMSGISTPGAGNDFFSKGVADAYNAPGSRMGATTWADASGNLWLFGGANITGYVFSDLWKYNISSGLWTWVSGDANAYNSVGVYGTKGTPAATNTPGGRQNASGFTDSFGNLYLYGGNGYAASGSTGELNDMWKYNISSGQWTWMHGSSATNSAGVYTTKGVPSTSSYPMSRTNMLSWKDGLGNFWIMDGTSVFNGYANDMWEYIASSNTWVWVGGSQQFGVQGVFGTKNIASPANIPSSRYGSATWTDAGGNLWLRGGYGVGSNGTGSLNDLWEFKIAINQWMWVGGSSLTSQFANYAQNLPAGNGGSPTANTIPGAKYNSITWVLPNNTLWLMAGLSTTDVNTLSNASNDLWVYKPVNTDSNAQLNSLSLSVGALTPVFSGTTTSYTATVPNNTASITVTPTTVGVGPLTVNGNSALTGFPSVAIALNVGGNTITVVSKSTDQSRDQTYTINVNRLAAAPAAPAITLSSNSAKNYVIGSVIPTISSTNTGGAVTSSFYAQTSTFAGSTSGLANGTGTAARFSGPANVIADASGNIYVSELFNHDIRKISPDGTVSILAGSGTAGFANGTGTAASFNTPRGMALDSVGNLYVADCNNNMIRKITPAGVVTTYAGTGAASALNGAGNVATFNRPWGLVFGPGGNLFVSDNSNQLIRKINPGAVVSTFAGTGTAGAFNSNGTSASFASPSGMTIDAAGNIYVIEYTNADIRKITPTGDVTTLAGGGFAGYADGTGTAALFRFPNDITIDNSGNLYVTDNSNYVVRKVTPAGVVTTIAGSPGVTGSADGVATAATFNFPYGLTYDKLSGNLYVADVNNARVRKITTSGYGISPALPAGLGISQTGQIFGTPTAPTPPTTYTFSAYNAGGSSSATISIATVLQPVPAISLSASSLTAALNTAITPVTTTNSGGTIPANKYGESSLFAGSTFGLQDGTGSAAKFYSPSNLITDPSGNIYVSDFFNNAIRKITPAGVVTTIAGNGTAGSADGTGTAATFNQPWGIAIDATGNLYVADGGNNKIRKITSAGVVSTFAGTGIAGFKNGGKDTVTFNHPQGITIDPSGNIFVADGGNNVIRKISIANVVSTYAGTGVAGATNGLTLSSTFRSPRSIKSDAAGNIYVADFQNHMIRKITTNGGVTTFAGTGVAGNADGVGTGASFNFPTDITFDPAGNLYITDELNFLIRKINPNGVVTTIAGGSQGNATGVGNAASFFYPLGLAYDAVSGNLYVGDNNNQQIKKVSVTGYTVTPNLPKGISIDGNGTISGTPTIVSPSGTYTVTGYNMGGSNSATVSIAVSAPQGPHISYGSGTKNYTVNNLITLASPSNTGSSVPAGLYGQVSTFAGTATVQGGTDGPVATATFGNPSGFVTDASGNLYVTEVLLSRIRKITPGGTVSTVAGTGAVGFANGTGTAAAFNQPRALVIDPSGNLLVSDQFNAVIRKVTPVGVVTTYAGIAGTAGSANGTLTTATFNRPWGMVYDQAGNLYVADFGNNLIRKISPAGIVTTFAGSGAAGADNGNGTSATFRTPRMLTIDGGGNLYVADFGNNLIRKITPNGDVTTFAGSGAVGSANGTGTSASFNGPSGMSADAVGNIYVADQASGLIRRITPDGKVSTIAGGVGNFINGIGSAATFNTPWNLMVDNTGNTLYIADNNNQMLRKIVNTGYSVSPALPAGLSLNADGSISGIPTVVKAAANYIIKAYNQYGMDSTVVSIAVNNIPAPVISYNTPQNYVTNAPISPLNVVSTGGTVPAGNALYIAPFAGSGVSGSANGTGLAATFGLLTGIAVDTAGNIYAPEYTSNLVRKITRDAVVTTFAGTGGAIFSGPNGAAVDRAGNVYIADMNHNRIAKVSPDGVVSNFAGSGTAGSVNGIGWQSTLFSTAATFNAPSAIAIDGAGYLYVTDSNSGLVRKISPSGATTTIGGGFLYPYGIAVDGTTGIVYVSDSSNKIFKIATNGTISLLAGSGAASAVNGTGAAASFNNPNCLVVDALGNVYVGDTNNHLVRKITPAGVVTTFLGSGTRGSTANTGTLANLTGPYGLAIDNKGVMYVSTSGHQIAKVQLNGYSVSPALPAGLQLSDAGTISGTPTVATSATNYTITAYNTGGSGSTIVNIATRTLSSNAKLSALTASTGTLSPVFSPDVTDYSVNVLSTVSGITLRPVASDTTSAIKVKSIALAGDSAKVTLVTGANAIPVEVTAQDGTTKTYTVTVYRGAPAGVITFTQPAAKAYGSADMTLAATSTNSDAPVTYTSSNADVATIIDGKIHILSAGTTTITASQAATPGHNAAVNVVRNFTVTKAPLTITADNKTKSFGQPNPPLTVSYSGFVNGETTDDLATQPVVATTATTASVAGTYAITPSGAAADNYAITYKAGVLTIGKLTLTITARNASRPYGGALLGSDIEFTYSGFVNGDTADDLLKQPVASITAGAASLPGTYPINVSGASSSVYTIVYHPGTLTITKAVLHVTATAAKLYGSPAVTITPSITGFRSGDNQANSVTTLPVAASAGNTVGANSANYPIIMTGGTSDKYSFDNEGGTLKVSKAALKVSVVSKTKTYGSPNPVFTATYTGWVNGDDESSLDAGPVFSCDASTASIVNTYDITASGVLAANYNVTYVAGSLKITKASLTVTADNQTRFVGETNPVFTSGYSGFVNGEDASSLNTQPVATTTATAASPAGRYYITPAGGTSGNYTLIYKSGILTIKSVIIASAGSNDFIKNSLSDNLLTNTTAEAITVHQAVSPNGDGVNDFLYIEGIENFPDNSVTIINPNGSLIYQATGYNNSNKRFDGRSNKGVMQQAGTYFYLITYTDQNEQKRKTGYIVIKDR